LKTLYEIYTGIKDKFYDKTKLDIEAGTVIDSYNVAVADAIEDAYTEIEASKDPHIYTNLSGDKIDSAGLLVNCARKPNEDDKTYLHRFMEWNASNEASNYTAIDNALLALEDASTAVYVPLTEGVSTATCYVFPKSYDGDGPDLAITEVKGRLEPVVSPSTIITYKVPAIIDLDMTIYISSSYGDIEIIKDNLNTKIKKYINSIAPGDYLELGAINKIGATEANVDYFNIVLISLNSKQTTSIKILQKLDSKFLLDNITWLVVSE
jgi:hypothetical protein